MITKKVERTVIVAENGMEFSVMENPERIENYDDLVKECRKHYGHLLDKFSFDDFLKERREEAEREWKEWKE